MIKEVNIFCIPSTKENSKTLIFKSKIDGHLEYHLTVKDNLEDFIRCELYITESYFEHVEDSFYINENNELITYKEVKDKFSSYRVLASTDLDLKSKDLPYIFVRNYHTNPITNGIATFESEDGDIIKMDLPILDRLKAGTINSEEALEELSNLGYCPNLLNDDNRHWAVTSDGFQEVPSSTEPEDLNTAFFVNSNQWKSTIKEALIEYLID